MVILVEIEFNFAKIMLKLFLNFNKNQILINDYIILFIKIIIIF